MSRNVLLIIVGACPQGAWSTAGYWKVDLKDRILQEVALNERKGEKRRKGGTS